MLKYCFNNKSVLSKFEVIVINKLFEYDENHDKLIDFCHLLPNWKSFFTSLNFKRATDKEVKKLITFFLNNGVDPNKPDKNSVYPLEHAIKLSCFPFVGALIESGEIYFTITIKEESCIISNFAISLYPFSIAKYKAFFSVQIPIIDLILRTDSTYKPEIIDFLLTYRYLALIVAF